MGEALFRALDGKTLLLTGGTGMIGKALVDLLLLKTTCRIVLFGRSKAKVRGRFPEHAGTERLHFVEWDPSHPTPLDASSLRENTPDYILHLASNTHPVAYATDPVSTVVMNVCATRDLLDLAVAVRCKRFLFASSVEIYGTNRGDAELFREDYCGHIDCNTLRAGYPESKRCGEALCQAYIRQYGLDVVIPRLARVYGPTILKTDTKALSQFIARALDGKDIVLKSKGDQFFSYLHVADAVSGLLTVLLKGTCGEAYNVSDERSDIRLRDLAALVAETAGQKVVFDLPDAAEQAGFSTATVARLDSTKLKALGWHAEYDIRGGLADTLASLKAQT